MTYRTNYYGMDKAIDIKLSGTMPSDNEVMEHIRELDEANPAIGCQYAIIMDAGTGEYIRRVNPTVAYNF